MLALDGSGGPGAANESGYCVFCSSVRFEQLSWLRDGRVVTRALGCLSEASRREALRLIEVHGGKNMAADFEKRVARALHRKDPARAKRRARGRYNKNQNVRGRRCKEEVRRSMEGFDKETDCWGIASVAKSRKTDRKGDATRSCDEKLAVSGIRVRKKLAPTTSWGVRTVRTSRKSRKSDKSRDTSSTGESARATGEDRPPAGGTDREEAS